MYDFRAYVYINTFENAVLFFFVIDEILNNTIQYHCVLEEFQYKYYFNFLSEKG